MKKHKVCLVCKKKFNKPSKESFKQFELRKHCSIKCQTQAKKGINLTKLHKEKISKSSFGKTFSQETRRKISEGHKGKNHYNWKGGISPKNKIIRHSIEYRLWREAVFARDNWTCQKTGTKGGKLHPHHIQNFADYPELRFAIDNGITLSEKVHREFHKKYGNKNNTKEQLEEFLKREL